jgi:anti-anti-sigma factor
VAADQAPALTVCDRWDDGAATVTVRGEIDAATSGVFLERLSEVVRGNPRRLVIDMAGVGFMDSAGLQAFMRVRGQVPERCPIIVRSAPPRVRQVFDVTGLSTVFGFE